MLAADTSTPQIADWKKRTPRSPKYPLGTPQTDIALNSVVIARVSTYRTQQVYWKVNDMQGSQQGTKAG